MAAKNTPEVEEPVADEPKASDTENATDSKVESGEQVVRYVGTSDVREIDAASFKRVGVENQPKVVWDASNSHTVKASDLTGPALEFLGKTDGFKVENV